MFIHDRAKHKNGEKYASRPISHPVSKPIKQLLKLYSGYVNLIRISIFKYYISWHDARKHT